MTTKAEVMRGLFIIFVALGTVTANMTSQEKRELKLEAEDMFYHAYDAYMFNAFPAGGLFNFILNPLFIFDPRRRAHAFNLPRTDSRSATQQRRYRRRFGQLFADLD